MLTCDGVECDAIVRRKEHRLETFDASDVGHRLDIFVFSPGVAWIMFNHLHLLPISHQHDSLRKFHHVRMVLKESFSMNSNAFDIQANISIPFTKT